MAQLPDYDELLERIKVIEDGSDKPKSDSLYHEFTLPDEEEIPDFLKEEQDLQEIKGDEN